jgi:imidazoleglycerol phosphate synthase glutamine amidotransferase subunit HisH
MSNSLVIVNTGCANISSVKFAFERLGINVDVSDDVKVIAKAQRVLLPGVGSAPAAMSSINKSLSQLLTWVNSAHIRCLLGYAIDGHRLTRR